MKKNNIYYKAIHPKYGLVKIPEDTLQEFKRLFPSVLVAICKKEA